MAVTKETPAIRADARECVFGFLVKPFVDEAFSTLRRRIPLRGVIDAEVAAARDRANSSK